MCSEYFINFRGRRLRLHEVPTLKLPKLAMQVSLSPPCRRLLRHALPERQPESSESGACKVMKRSNAAVNTHLTCANIESLEKELSEVKCQLQQFEQVQHDLKERQLFRFKNIGDDDAKVRFYTGFSTLSALMACFNFLGRSVNHLKKINLIFYVMF